MRKALVVASAVLALVLTGCTSAAVEPLPAPPKVSVVPTATTLADFSDVSLPKVDGTTTTAGPIPFFGGAATISGRVTLGGGPVGGATVHVERYDGDVISGSTDVTSDQGGYFKVSSLHGGRYRVRAYRPPDATMTQAVTFFLGANENKSSDLTMGSFSGGITVGASVSPDPPILGTVSTLVVSVSTRGVDGNGVARSIPMGGVGVTLLVGGGRSVVTANPTATAANGRALFSFQCTALTGQNISVIVPGASAVNLSVTPCQPVPTTTTTVAPDETTDTTVVGQQPVTRSTTTTAKPKKNDKNDKG